MYPDVHAVDDGGHFGWCCTANGQQVADCQGRYQHIRR